MSTFSGDGHLVTDSPGFLHIDAFGHQVLADKPGEWQLRINAKGTVDWAVNLAGKMTVATGATVLKPQLAGVPAGYVIKATHAGGDIKVFVCALSPTFKCTMPTPDGVSHGSLPLVGGSSNITWGASKGGAGGTTVTDYYDGGNLLYISSTSLHRNSP